VGWVSLERFVESKKTRKKIENLCGRREVSMVIDVEGKWNESVEVVEDGARNHLQWILSFKVQTRFMAPVFRSGSCLF